MLLKKLFSRQRIFLPEEVLHSSLFLDIYGRVVDYLMHYYLTISIKIYLEHVFLFFPIPFISVYQGIPICGPVVTL
jgi:hypothetical protein